MVLSYVNKNTLYLNLTNLCTNRCEFCVRENAYPEEGMPDLRLEREPTLEEILEDLSSYNLNNFSEIVFGGCGEPTCRLYDVLETCKFIRERSSALIRLNTNGHASMILTEDTAPAFKGLIDCVSISLYAADSDTYMKLCRPRFGEDTFTGVVKFAREVVKYVPQVVLTAVRGTLSDADLERCAQIAEGIGASFRVRDLLSD